MNLPDFHHIELERGRADFVAILRFNRPEARNAINHKTMEDLELALDVLEADETLRGVVVTARGEGVFVAGGDIKDLEQLDSPEKGRQMSERMQTILARLESLPVVTIAAIGGNAYGGGCEIALACDLRVMSASAHFVFAQARMGLVTGWGGGPRLVREVGRSRALELLTSGRYLSAERAAAMGLVVAVSEDGAALSDALDLARQITRHSRPAIAAAKRVVNGSAELPLQQAVKLENQVFLERWHSPEHLNAVRSFLSRKPPTFK